MTTVKNSQSLEYSRLSDSIIEEGPPGQTSSALPRVTRSLPKEKVTKKKKKKKKDQCILTAPDLGQTVSSSIFTLDDKSIQIGGDGTRSEDLSHLSTRRTSRSSTVKTALGSTSSPALLRAPSSNSLPSKSKPSSQAITSKGSRVSAIVRLEESAPLSLHPTTSQKGKGVDKGEVICLTLDTQPTGRKSCFPKIL